MFETTNQDTSTGLPDGSILSPVPPGTSAPGISFSCCESPRSMACVYTGPWDGEHVDEIWWNDGAEKKDLQYLPVIRMESVSDQSYDISLSDLVIFYRKTSGKTMEKTHGISAAWMTSQVFWTNHSLLQFGDISNLLRPAGERPVWGPAIFSNRTGGGSIWDTQFMVKNILW